MSEPEVQYSILRGTRIEEFATNDLCDLYRAIEMELPEKIDDVNPADIAKLLELELIEDELERRNERL